MMHGFQSSIEPLLVSMTSTQEAVGPPAIQNGIHNFALGFVKGSARMSTLQTILALCMQDCIDLKKDHGLRISLHT